MTTDWPWSMARGEGAARHGSELDRLLLQHGRARPGTLQVGLDSRPGAPPRPPQALENRRSSAGSRTGQDRRRCIAGTWRHPRLRLRFEIVVVVRHLQDGNGRRHRRSLPIRSAAGRPPAGPSPGEPWAEARAAGDRWFADRPPGGSAREDWATEVESFAPPVTAQRRWRAEIRRRAAAASSRRCITTLRRRCRASCAWRCAPRHRRRRP